MKYYAKDHFNILFHDNHVLVVEKPAGFLTQPNIHNAPNIEDLAKQWCRDTFGKETVFLHAIHRLDKDVSGIVLFARSSKALKRFNEQMRAKKILRQYVAIIEGDIEQDQGMVEHYLVHGDHKAYVVTNPTEGKKASLHYQVLSRREDRTVVCITLDTGRYHQIRAQFSAISHPIVGDNKYGSQRQFSRILLHQHHLGFEHPVTKDQIDIYLIPSFLADEEKAVIASLN